ncbi:conserved protein of unknown function [Bradyrhizobium vignae]|uniref:Uncharacterized protein n=1 Tax=Bradyrhizobium vignae TaxID=1549949 RepID=A0A2U3PTW8_9BRAD|nr:conserved protein of unknown function [Bradyrhizobium vignae]
MRRDGSDLQCEHSLRPCPGRAATLFSTFTRVFDALWRCCAEPGTQQLHGIPTHGPRLCFASSKERYAASGARGQSDGAWEVTQSLHHWHSSQTHPRILATDLARALLRRLALVGKRAQGRPGARWHPRSTVRILRNKKLHSGIQVKPGHPGLPCAVV